MCCRKNSKGLCLAAFGIGLFVACCFPSSVTIVIIASILVIAGLALCRR